MENTSETELERLTRLYREHEHEPDTVIVFCAGMDYDEVPSKKTEILEAIKTLTSLPPPTDEEKQDEAAVARGIFTSLRDERGIRIR